MGMVAVGGKPPLKLNHRHEGLMNWLVMNPHRTLGEAARELNYTRAWISTVINSDLFQAEYKARCAMMGEIAAFSITERLGKLADITLERVEQRLDSPEASDAFLVSTMNSTLDRLGFTPKAAKGAQEGGFVQNNTIIVTGDSLAQARERAAQVHSKVLELSAEPMKVVGEED